VLPGHFGVCINGTDIVSEAELKAQLSSVPCVLDRLIAPMIAGAGLGTSSSKMDDRDAVAVASAAASQVLADASADSAPFDYLNIEDHVLIGALIFHTRCPPAAADPAWYPDCLPLAGSLIQVARRRDSGGRLLTDVVPRLIPEFVQLLHDAVARLADTPDFGD